MHILLFGISNIGKTTVGRLLAERLGFRFFDIDEEIKRKYKITLSEFVARGTLEERDQARCSLLRQIASRTKSDAVVAVSPLSHIDSIKTLLRRKSVLAVELTDSPENIFNRIVFSDENDVVYRDDDYKNAHKEEYLEDILEDQEHYGAIYAAICVAFDMNGDDAETCAKRLAEYVKGNSRHRS